MSEQEPLAPEDFTTEIEALPTNNQEWKSLHPLSLLINLLPQMWRTVRSTWPFLVFIFIGGEGVGAQFIDLVFVLIFLLLSMMETNNTS